MRRCDAGRVIVAVAATAMLCIGCGSTGELPPQCYSLNQFSRMVSPSFSLYIMKSFAETKNRIDVYVQVPYAKLRFEKKINAYHASVTVTVILRDMKNEIVHSKEVDRSIEVATYEESTSQHSEFILERIHSEPGQYMLEIVSRDNLSKLHYRAYEKMSIREYDSTSVSASSVLFLNGVVHDGKTLSLRPILPDFISYARDSIGYFQEVYNIQYGDTITVSHLHFKPELRNTSVDRFIYWAPPYRVDNTACITAEKVQYYRHDSTFVSDKTGTIRIVQFYPVPLPGFSIVQRKIVVSSAPLADSNEVDLNIFRRDPDHRHSPSLGEIIAAMRYILREQEYDSLAAATTQEAVSMIDKFWDGHGGRQKRIDFERKVMEANSLFTSCVDGSRTPMGIVYIMCGVPDYVDCRGSFNENWYYTIGERTYVAQFRPVNDSDSVQYFELVPFSINESFWQYNIDRWRKKK